MDTTAFVRVHSIVYATYLGAAARDLEGEAEGRRHAAGAWRSSGTDLLEVVQLFDQQAREDLSETLVNVGFGAAGRGTELNGALRDLPETWRETPTDQLRARPARRAR